MRRFFAGLVLGAVASLSLSVGLIPMVVVFIVVVLIGAAIKSFAAVSGSLIGWGLTWSVFFYISFGKSMCNGIGCDQGQSILPFLGLALAIAAAGLVLGVARLTWTTLQARRQSTA